MCVMMDVVRVVTTDPSDFWTLLGWKTATFGCYAGFTELCDVVQPGGRVVVVGEVVGGGCWD